jgi:hypothetical protein
MRAGSPGGDAGFLRKYGDGGDELWTRLFEFYAPALAADGTGVYVSGTDYIRKISYLRKYSRYIANRTSAESALDLDTL